MDTKGDASNLSLPSDRLGWLMREGKKVEATSPLVDVNIKPIYFDEVRLKRAQITCKKYYTNLSMGSSTGLILLVQMKSILIPLLKTGRSRTIPDLYDRYTATAKSIRKYYETDFYDQTSEGWAAISIVRAMHKRIHALMNQPAGPKKTSSQDNANAKSANDVYVNQYDMGLTQFAFLGLFIIRPDLCGAYYVSEAEMSDIVYYWRLISYHFGIEDQFNIFVYHDDLAKQAEYMRLILQHFNTSLDSEPRILVGVQMAEGILISFEEFLTETTFNILDRWWKSEFSLTGRPELRPYTINERWKLIFFHLYFKVLFRSETFLSFINEKYKQKFDRFCNDGDRIKAKQAKKYQNIKYELEEPFELNI